MMLILVLDLQLPAHDNRSFEVDIADVGDYQLPTRVFAIYDGIVQDEGRQFVAGGDRLQNRQLGNVLDVVRIDGGNS